jgi:uncharacterized protein DUF4136
MKLVGSLLALMLSFAQAPPKEGTIATVKDPKADFGAYTTYTWEKGYDAYDPAVHKAIVEAIDAEMAARGFRKLPSGTGSVNIRYHTVVRTDVVLDKLDEMEREKKPTPTKNLGRLVIVMRDTSNRRVWAADTVQPIPPNTATHTDLIRQTVGRLFETYPGPRKPPAR